MVPGLVHGTRVRYCDMTKETLTRGASPERVIRSSSLPFKLRNPCAFTTNQFRNREIRKFGKAWLVHSSDLEYIITRVIMGGFETVSGPHENTSDCESQCSKTCIHDEFDHDSGGMEGDSEEEYPGGVEWESIYSKRFLVDSSMQCDEKEIACAGSKSISHGQDPPSFFTEKGTLYYCYRESYTVTNHVGAQGGRSSYVVLSEHISINYKKRPDLKGVDDDDDDCDCGIRPQCRQSCQIPV